MTQSKKEKIQSQRESEKCNIDDFCKENGIGMKHINDYQIRLNKRVDVYPTNKKYCILNAFGGKWGRYEKVEDLLRFFI